MTPIEQLKNMALSFGAEVLENEPMSRHTTFKIGGPADLFITASGENTIKEIAQFCNENDIPLFVIGNGSNLLVSDKGIRGVVLRLGRGKIICDGEKIICSAGVPLRSLCETAKDNCLTGLEFAYGIPGSVGGAVYMNAGAYGGEMKDVVTASTHIQNGKIGKFENTELDFGYRKSAYTGKDYIILSAEFKLSRGDKKEIEAKMSELMNRRRTKQPLEYPSAGSVFKRPVGYYAGTLIESCGLKGHRVGGAVVSEKHAGFIVNTGGATCEDVLKLIEEIQNEVLKKAGVMLECEIKTVGEK